MKEGGGHGVNPSLGGHGPWPPARNLWGRFSDIPSEASLTRSMLMLSLLSVRAPRNAYRAHAAARQVFSPAARSVRSGASAPPASPAVPEAATESAPDIAQIQAGSLRRAPRARAS